MYAYSNNGFNMRSVDSGMETPDEVVFDHLADDGELDAAFPGRAAALQTAAAAQVRTHAQAQVESLERSQARSVREALLTGDKSRLALIEQQIAQLTGRAPVGM